MSSKNRSINTPSLDIYYTPAFCVHRILEVLDLPGGLWLDAGAGAGALIKATNEKRNDITWVATEIRESEKEALSKLTPHVVIGDFLSWSNQDVINITFPLACQHTFNVGIANPPFGKAMEFLEKMLQFCDWVVLLQRVNYLGSQSRAEFFAAHAPNLYVLPDRPIFNGKHGDSIEYAWFVYGPGEQARNRSEGTLKVLALTPLKERQQHLQFEGDPTGQGAPKKPKVRPTRKTKKPTTLSADPGDYPPEEEKSWAEERRDEPRSDQSTEVVAETREGSPTSGPETESPLT